MTNEQIDEVARQRRREMGRRRFAFDVSVSYLDHTYRAHLYTHTVPWWGKTLAFHWGKSSRCNQLTVGYSQRDGFMTSFTWKNHTYWDRRKL